MFTVARSRFSVAVMTLMTALIFLAMNVATAAANPGIAIEKHTNGEDADDPTGPEIPVGDPVLWEYFVSNVGNLDLANVVVSDDQGVSVSCPKTSLVVGENMVCTGTGVAEAGQYANVGCADVIRNGQVILSACDPSHYFGKEPPPPTGEGCTYTQGYWKTHGPDAKGNNSNEWPVTSLTLGVVTYTDAELQEIMDEPVRGNGLVSLSHQLIAAKLNVIDGADDGAIAAAIADADALIAGLIIPPVGSDSLSTSVTSSLNDALTDYNEGTTGPGHCD